MNISPKIRIKIKKTQRIYIFFTNQLMQISLTGNPFVDNGLGIIASLSGCESIDDLTLEHMQELHGNGETLARWNSKLKITNMIFGMNSMVLQNQIDPEKRVLYYR